MTPPDDVSAESLEAELLARLVELRRRRREDPGFNPVWRLACDISFRLERGELDRDRLCRLGGRLRDRSLEERGAGMRGMLAPMAPEDIRRQLDRTLEEDTRSRSFPEFAARWSTPRLGCVFTAHPTFLLSPAERARLLGAVAGTPRDDEESEDAQPREEAITLVEEHAEALQAIANARAAFAFVCRTVLESARRAYPRDWRRLRPQPVDLASWVGYDMDGRTDIDWDDCIRLRLIEKRTQLGWYLDDIEAILAEHSEDALTDALGGIRTRLKAAESHTTRAIELFSQDLSEPAALAAAADWLSSPHEDRLTSLDPILEILDDLITNEREGEAALELAVLRAKMASFRLGIGRIHFRINATQLHNAVRRRLGDENSVDLGSRTALVRLNELSESVRPVKVNFAALAVETATAMRQMISIAQIRKHIDSESDIRLLIAETERPATVLAAVYLARLFGIGGCVDISPLFETAPALETGERFLDVLFSQPAYRKAVEERGRVTIQTGFSDAGRFIGQIPAALAIERLQANLARLMEKHRLTELEALIFNTHGESMGRGAHPGGIAARLDHALSPWAQAQFASRNLRLRNEVSFQGGDGYLWFADPMMAASFLSRAIVHLCALVGRQSEAGDPFYEAPDISLDFYRRIMGFQDSVMALPAYHRTLSAFALSLLKPTGSRKSRRQFEGGGGERADLAKIRAIPHNAALQQLGYPVNVVGGLGQATRSNREPFTDWRRDSARFSGLIDLVVEGRRRASLRTMVAYGSLFDAGFWAIRPHGDGQAHLTEACLYLADRLEGDDRYPAARELAARLRIDELLLHQFLAETGEDKTVMDAEERDALALLHALRIALIQHLFLMAARIPRFSARNDISREDIMELVFELRTPEAVALLREAYPEAAPSAQDFSLAETASYPDESAPDYGAINRRLIDPMVRIHRCLLTISVAIANIWRAHG